MIRLLLIILLFLNLSLMAQVKESSIYNFKSVEWNIGNGSYYGFSPKMGYALQLGIGKVINQKYDIGIGTGLEVIDPLQLSFYTDVKRYFLKQTQRRKWSVYNRIGMAVPLSNYTNENHHASLGLILIPTLSYQFNKYLDIHLGYRYQRVKYKAWTWNGEADVIYQYRRIHIACYWKI